MGISAVHENATTLRYAKRTILIPNSATSPAPLPIAAYPPTNYAALARHPLHSQSSPINPTRAAEQIQNSKHFPLVSKQARICEQRGHLTDFSRTLISQTRPYSLSRISTSQVTAAMKNGHVGYKAVYSGPASGSERISWDSSALSFTIVGCDLVRL